ncbi:MAG: endonuclease/exonuclease/phosphatase family protein [Dysgonamonadaceae bacterium]|jgi:endonuclease/exonuclease/phosphatase family metal-dependent hydrolase|nr:endonuclease/exonuclease/phosphatase family protein [Dysgonamonadaceae bacterium]
MKKTIFLSITMGLFFLFLACQKEPGDIVDPGWEKESDSKQLIVMTYNVRYCTPYLVENAKPDIDAIAAIINKAKPDVVFLQEIDKNTTRSGKVDQLAELSKKTNMPFTFFGKGQDYQGGEFGCAFLSRINLSDPQLTVYPRVESQTNDRIMIQATIKVGDKQVAVACTHLGLYQEERDAEVPAVNSKLSTSLYPVIFGGDLNAIPENSTITTLLGYGFTKTNTFTTFTIPSDKPNRQLDYIMYKPANRLKVISHTVLPERASDHLAVVAVFEIQD